MVGGRAAWRGPLMSLHQASADQYHYVQTMSYSVYLEVEISAQSCHLAQHIS